MKWLIFGHKGWIGGQVINLLKQLGEDLIYPTCRADNEMEVENVIKNERPDRVISLIGRTSGGNFNTIDYLEQKGKLVENINDNLYAPFVLAMICKKYNVHLTYMGTGCIFNGYKDGIGYKEDDKPDFTGSSYSTVKGFTDRMMHFFEDNVLNVRIRMPITDTYNPRNFITKITKYEKICSIPNSMTVLPELIPLMLDMAKNETTGTINLTNPGLISHNEILEMYKEIVDPDFTWQNFTLEEQDKILLGGRSNDLLNTDRLQSLYPNTTPIKEAVRRTLHNMKKN